LSLMMEYSVGLFGEAVFPCDLLSFLIQDEMALNKDQPVYFSISTSLFCSHNLSR
jgi:hypothetical protein